MSALMIATDLMATSAASGAAQRAGVTLRTATPKSASGALLETTRLVVIDLSAPGLTVASVVTLVRENAPNATVVAFGPHVQEQRLTEAVAAGCDEVISRGQWHKQAEQLLRDHAG